MWKLINFIFAWGFDPNGIPGHIGKQIAEKGWKWLEMAGMAENGGKWLEWQEMAGNGSEWLLVAGIQSEQLEIAGNGLKRLTIAGINGVGHLMEPYIYIQIDCQAMTWTNW